MATFEQIGLVFQVIRNIYGLVNNMRDNANSYKIDTRGVVYVGDIMKQDANEYIRRMGWITSLATRNQTLLSNALSVLGLTLANANNLKTTLLDVANHTKLANLSDQTKINIEADYILANVPNYERVW